MLGFMKNLPCVPAHKPALASPQAPKRIVVTTINHLSVACRARIADAQADFAGGGDGPVSSDTLRGIYYLWI